MRYRPLCEGNVGGAKGGDMFDEVPVESRIKIGPIAFLVVSALPIAIAIHLLVDHPANESEGLMNMILALIMMFLSLAIGVIGVIITVSKSSKQEPILFWLLSTSVVAIPGLYVGGTYLWFFLTH